jgi:hypothetical protein
MDSLTEYFNAQMEINAIEQIHKATQTEDDTTSENKKKSR